MKHKNTKRLYSTAIAAITLVAILATPLQTAAQTDNYSDENPVDLTKLVITTDNNTEQEITTSQDNETATNQPIATSPSLTTRDPSSIRLGALGLERGDLDTLSRLMWEGSNAQNALKLIDALNPQRIPRALQPAVNHIIVSRTVPPEGFIDIAPQIIAARLKWLSSSGESHDLAEIIRQLPNSEEWKDNKKWLVFHDLITRNDDHACQTAQRQILITLESLWHQVNAFCAVIKGDTTQAAFALDILEDSGVEDTLYFDLMRLLTNGDSISIQDQTNLSLLHLILMDTARITIEEDALKNIPHSYHATIPNLRYLSPAASRLIGARSSQNLNLNNSALAQNISGDITQSWALLPRDDVSSSEALTRLRFGGDRDTLALARLDAWHAISAEKDQLSAASLAFEAMLADYRHTGISALNLWLPIIEGGVKDSNLNNKIGPLIGFGNAPSKVAMNEEAAAWHDVLEASSPRPLSPQTLAEAEAYDAIPLILAAGRPINNPDWTETDPATTRPLATKGTSLPYIKIRQIENAAEQGLIAETVLRIAILLQDRTLASLNRDDAARLIAVLMRLDMKLTAQNLARDILMTWGADRYFSELSQSASQGTS